MQYKQLGNTDLQLSILGYGASPLGSVFQDIKESEGIRTVHTALDQGINYIDCSPYYGLTKAETVLGKALKGVNRDRYILSTKAGRYGPDFDDFDMSPQRIQSSLEESLVRLGVDELDMFLLHDIEFVDLEQVIHESLPYLDRLKKAGKIRYFGITGYPLKSFQQVVEQYDIDCVLSYCRYALHDDSLTQLMPLLKEKGVGLINASPTAMGLLTKRGAPDWHPAAQELIDCCRAAEAVCLRYGVDLTQVAMQYAVHHQAISSTLVGTANPINLLNNIEWIKEPINAELVLEIKTLFDTCAETVWVSGRSENQDQ
ncbi:aldo/keto reductase [Marinomonas sp. 15G1-11]|uniref:Aldo/keto reductase n=1 Tax=Marinomonas phaeophyticola TaxID=3004091 RepID=A0ABT4JTS1_9GAMM|nr:aldo/keto reductase [Marinomonas sp. 15G1-11]MCZ2720989.1 aldo/keto reductase [Marinomonas sp. 15G1-11]